MGPRVQAEPPEAHVVHSTDGRTRIRVPSERRNSAFFRRVVEELSQCETVSKIEAKPLSGGVLVHYQGDFDVIADWAVRKDLFTLVDQPVRNSGMLDRLDSEMDVIDRRINAITAGEANLASLVFLGLLMVAAVQLLRGNIMGPAMTMAWYAVNAALAIARPHAADKS